LVVVDYEPLPPVKSCTEAGSGDVLVHQGYPGNLVGEISGPAAPDVEAVFAS
jgi:hypothetical protein